MHILYIEPILEICIFHKGVVLHMLHKLKTILIPPKCKTENYQNFPHFRNTNSQFVFDMQYQLNAI